MVDNRRQSGVRSRISEDGVVPSFEVRVVGNEIRQSLPLVGGGNKAGAVRTDLGGTGVGRLE